MKKLLLIISLVFTYDLNAANRVPIVWGVSSELQAKVYHQITNNGFVYLLDPDRRKVLSDIEVKQVIEDEQTFITNKIHDVCPDAKVTFIPKSLYQLCVYRLLLKQIDEAGEKVGIVPLLSVYLRWFYPAKEENNSIGFLDIFPSISLRRNLSSGVNFSFSDAEFSTILDNIPDPIKDYFTTETKDESSIDTLTDLLMKIDAYHSNRRVQSAFWEINDDIASSLLPTLTIVDEETLKECVSRLIKDITIKRDNIAAQKQKVDQCLSMVSSSFREDLSCRGSLYCALWSTLQFSISCKIKFLAPIIEQLIIEEFNASSDTYRIYRGESTSLTKRIDNAYSFSDGLFGGIIRDYWNGSAFSCFTTAAGGNNKLMIVDLPKKDLLNGEIPVVVPPVSPMGSALGDGEFHHIRAKRVIGDEHKEFEGLCCIPKLYLVDDKQELEDFWSKLYLRHERVYLIQYIQGDRLNMCIKKLTREEAAGICTGRHYTTSTFTYKK